MAEIKRKDAQRLAHQLVDAIAQMRTDMARQDATIQRQAAEIQRLRAAGDDLAKSLAEFCDPWDEMRVIRWQEARRG